MANNFNTQISTTVEQSKRLLGLGLKTETADMAWRYQHTVKGEDKYEVSTDVPTHERKLLWVKCASLRQEFLSHWVNPDGTPMPPEEIYDAVWGKDIPAWSLHRLIAIMPDLIKDHIEEMLYHQTIDANGVMYENMRHELCQFIGNNLYDCIIDCIEWLIAEEYFFEDYLTR